MFRRTDVRVNLAVWHGLVRGLCVRRKNGLGHEGMLWGVGGRQTQ
jgi:hypothetical protein